MSLDSIAKLQERIGTELADWSGENFDHEKWFATVQSITDDLRAYAPTYSDAETQAFGEFYDAIKSINDSGTAVPSDLDNIEIGMGLVQVFCDLVVALAEKSPELAEDISTQVAEIDAIFAWDYTEQVDAAAEKGRAAQAEAKQADRAERALQTVEAATLTQIRHRARKLPHLRM